MVPFATAAAEYGALASRGASPRLGDLVDALGSPSLESVAWLAAAALVGAVATRRKGRLAFLVLLVCAAAVAVAILAR